MRAMAGTEGGPELVAEEPCQREEKDLKQFEHPGRIADPVGWSFALLQPVSGLEAGARTGTERNVELVPQEQVLEHKVVPSAKESGHGGEEEAH